MVITDPNSEVGALNKRRLGAISVGRTAGFEIIHGLLDRIMQALAVSRNRYSLRAADGKLFFFLKLQPKVIYFSRPGIFSETLC